MRRITDLMRKRKFGLRMMKRGDHDKRYKIHLGKKFVVSNYYFSTFHSRFGLRMRKRGTAPLLTDLVIKINTCFPIIS